MKTEIIAKLEIIEETLSAIKNLLADTPKETDFPAAEAPDAAASISKEDVRKLLVEKSNMDGGIHKPAVKDLVKKYSGTGQLSAIAPEHYASLLKELEGIGNA